MVVPIKAGLTKLLPERTRKKDIDTRPESPKASHAPRERSSAITNKPVNIKTRSVYFRSILERYNFNNTNGRQNTSTADNSFLLPIWPVMALRFSSPGAETASKTSINPNNINPANRRQIAFNTVANFSSLLMYNHRVIIAKAVNDHMLIMVCNASALFLARKQEIEAIKKELEFTD